MVTFVIVWYLCLKCIMLVKGIDPSVTQYSIETTLEGDEPHRLADRHFSMAFKIKKDCDDEDDDDDDCTAFSFN